MALASLVAANLAPVFGVLFLGWKAGDIVVLYWVETLIVIVFTRLRMAHLPRDWDHYEEGEHRLRRNGVVRPPREVPGFFLFFYGMFWTVLGFFLLMFTATIMSHNWISFGAGIGALVISHGISFRVNYIGQREYENTSLGRLFNLPMRRVLFLHAFTYIFILLASMIQAVNVHFALPVFVVLKTIGDVYAHLKEHGEAHAKLGIET